VESPVVRVVMLVFARFTHLELRHGSPLAVVRHIVDDRETRTTVGAVGECVPTTAVLGVEDVLQAIVAGCEVRRDMHRRKALLL
jgi:hypothetical protein